MCSSSATYYVTNRNPFPKLFLTLTLFPNPNPNPTQEHTVTLGLQLSVLHHHHLLRNSGRRMKFSLCPDHEARDETLLCIELYRLIVPSFIQSWFKRLYTCSWYNILWQGVPWSYYPHCKTVFPYVQSGWLLAQPKRGATNRRWMSDHFWRK